MERKLAEDARNEQEAMVPYWRVWDEIKVHIDTLLEALDEEFCKQD